MSRFELEAEVEMPYYKVRVDVEEMSTGADSRLRVRLTRNGETYETWTASRSTAVEMAREVLADPSVLSDEQWRADRNLELD